MGTCNGPASPARSERQRPDTTFEDLVSGQPLVRLWCCTETGEAPRGQGATTENTDCI